MTRLAHATIDAIDPSDAEFSYRYVLNQKNDYGPLANHEDDEGGWEPPGANDVGNWLQAVGDGVAQGVPGAAGELAGRAISAAGLAIGGMGETWDRANEGHSAGYELGRLTAGIVGSTVGSALAIAALTANPGAALLIGGLLAVNPPLGIAAIAAAAIIGGLVGQNVAQNEYEELADLINDARPFLDDLFDGEGPGWFDPGGPFYFPPISPLVLDLNGNGLEIIPLADSSAYFDLNENGFAELTAWVGPTDGFLVLDVNLNGRVDDLSEMFGGQDVDGFTRLAEHDSNGDGVIDLSDAIFGSLQIWNDLDSDGFTDAGELRTLGELGVESIDLNADFVDYWDRGNWISHTSGFGSVGGGGAIFDIWFDNDQRQTIYLNDQSDHFSTDILILPQLAGYGSVASLSSRVYEDADFRDLVEQLVLDSATLSIGELKSRIETMLHHWAGVQDVSTTGRGSSVNGRELAFLEALHGQGFTAFGGSPNPGARAGEALSSYYDTALEAMAARILSQLAISHAYLVDDPDAAAFHQYASFAQFFYLSQTDSLVGMPDRFLNLLALDIAAPGLSDTDAAALMVERLAGLRWFSSDLFDDDGQASAQILAELTLRGIDADLLEIAEVAMSGNVLQIGTSGADAISVSAGGTVVFGGEGDDVMTGGGDGDVYVYTRGHGHDAITEGTQGGIDRLLLTGIEPSDVTLVRSGNSVTLVIAESSPGAGDGGSVLLTNQVDPSGERGMEFVEFGNGAIWTAADIRRILLADAATPGDDVIVGTESADAIRGGSGDDVMNGAGGADVYSWARGDGHDQIAESTNNGADRLVLEGIDPSAVSLVRNGLDVTLVIAESAPGAGDGARSCSRTSTTPTSVAVSRRSCSTTERFGGRPIFA